MSESNREIIAGRGFYYFPLPFITMKVSVESPYDSRQMKDTLQKLEYVHPTINDIVEKSDNRMWFRDTNLRIPLTEYPYTPSVRWEDIITDASKEVIDISKEPGVRFYIIDRGGCFDLMMSCHHLYGDGMSVKQVMDDLLSIYATGSEPEAREPKLDFTTDELPEDCKIAPAFKETLNKINQAWPQHKAEFSADTYRTLGNTINQMFGYGYSRCILKDDSFDFLRTACSEHGITVTAALTTAMVAALQETKNCDSGMSSVIAVSCRDMLGYGNDKSLTNFSSCITPHLKYDNSIPFWSNAKLLDTRIKDIRRDKAKVLETYHSFLEMGADLFGAALHARCGIYRDFEMLKLLKNALSAQDNSFDISNLGKTEFECQKENVTIRDCYFAPNLATACDYAFGVMTVNNELTISVGYKDKSISKETIEAVLKRILDYISSPF